MKYLFSLSAVLSVVLANQGFVQFPVTARKVNGTSSKSSIVNGKGTISSAKAGYVPDNLQNGVFQYFVDIELGTPGQKQTVSIDTGSSDLWVYGPEVQNVQYNYDPSQSSSSHYVNNGFDISYVDGSGASGPYYTDDVELGGVSVNVQFGVAQQTGRGDGVFGVASTSGEADSYGTYPNYPVALKQQGYIESTAYSLYLDDVNAQSGSLLFGGVDTGKYSGQLYTIPITSPGSFSVDFEFEGHQLNGVLDAGTSLTYLPDDLFNGLVAKWGPTFRNNGPLGAGYYTDNFPSSASLTYSFSGAQVTVPASEIFISAGDGSYFFTLLSTEESLGNILLGDSFLRSAYVVYDLDSNQIGIAQADYHGSGPIRVITENGIPGAVPAPEL